MPYLAQFCSDFNLRKKKMPLKLKNIFLIHQNLASYGIYGVFCSEILNQIVGNLDKLLAEQMFGELRNCMLIACLLLSSVSAPVQLG